LKKIDRSFDAGEQPGKYPYWRFDLPKDTDSKRWAARKSKQNRVEPPFDEDSRGICRAAMN
jgi:hypothetical protein